MSAPPAADTYSAPNTGAFVEAMRVDWIHPSPQNPRRTFDETALDELAASLKAHGLLEPVVVRRVGPESFELIAGERRWRAAQRAGLTEIPTRVLVDVDDATALRLALVENLQRVDLDPIEEAEGYRALHQVIGLKQAEIAAAVHKSQPTIANAMRLLDLPDDVVERIRKGQLSPSHGIALARFKEYPVIVGVMAEWAAQNKTTSKELERGVPAAQTLVNRKLVVSMDAYYQDGVDREYCSKSCPFGAWRADERGFYGHLCLRPDHYAELAAEAATAKQARVEVAATALEESRNGEVRWDDLGANHNLYARVGDPPPPGCSEACACRRAIMGPEDRWRNEPPRLMTICIEPDHFGELVAAESKRQEEAFKADVRARRKAFREQLAAISVLGGRELVPLVVRALPWSANVGPIRETAQRYGIELPKGIDTYRLPVVDLVRALQDVDPVVLVRFALEAIIGPDLALHTNDYRRSPWPEIYLAGLPPADPPARADQLEGVDRFCPECEACTSDCDCPTCGLNPPARSCRECGCTDEWGCDGGCEWVGDDLCSACAEAVDA